MHTQQKPAGRWLRRFRRLVSVTLAFGMLVGAIAWMSGAFHKKVAPGTVEVQRRLAAGRTLAPVEVLPTTETIDAVGTVQPRRKTDVASHVLATIREVKVTPGTHVKAGQSLVVLDDREIQAQLREAEAAVTGARADLDVRQRDYKRYEQLFQQNALAREEFDRAEGALRNAEAQLKRLEEQVSRIRVTLSYTEINAQTDGIVADRYVDPGDLAVPGKPLLTLYEPHERELHANVPESLAASIKLGMELGVRIDAVGRDCQGTVREIVPMSQEGSRSVLVKVTLPEPAADSVYIGMFGRLRIPRAKVQRLVLPVAAIHEVGQSEFVDAVLPDGALERRFVRTGRPYGDKVEILSGVRAGEQVALPKSP